MKNEPAELGGTAVLKARNLTILATSLPGFRRIPRPSAAKASISGLRM